MYERCKCMKLIYVLIRLIVKNLSRKDLAFISLFSVICMYLLLIWDQVQLTVKGSWNRGSFRFEEPFTVNCP